MMIFVQLQDEKNGIRIFAIPSEKVGSIEMFGSTVRIWYNNGNVEAVADGSCIQVMSDLCKHYKSGSELLRVSRDFYLACKRNDSVFCF